MNPDHNQPASYHAILDAAIEEFADKGYAGLRMEHVAKRAGFNKSLIYRFFTDRDQLFRAALQRQFEQRDSLLDEIPKELGELLTWWTARNRSNPQFVRMIMREALDGDAQSPVSKDERSQYYQKQIAFLRQLQEAGQASTTLDTSMLFLALLAITLLPEALPQIVTLVTGKSAETVDFQEQWAQFLSNLANQLSASRE